MIGEIVAAVAKEGAKETAIETIKEGAKKSVDISKRIEASEKISKEVSAKVDISKRIQVEKGDIKSIKEAINEYIDDLKEKSEVANTIDSEDLKNGKIEISSPEKVAEKRKEFDKIKSDLRKKWEEVNNMDWPKYAEDVYNEAGKLIRKAGDYYDAHHIKPLKLGGDNTVSNITPLRIDKHKDIHSKEGKARQLVDTVKELGK